MKLYVGDMAPGTGRADLRRHFGRYGDVTNIFIPKCRLTGAPRCCAFVQFSNPHEAASALADRRRHVINGREVPIVSTLLPCSFFFFPRIVNERIVLCCVRAIMVFHFE
jgi:heterogeneous nuclear ribonucleoprotein A1/A3